MENISILTERCEISFRSMVPESDQWHLSSTGVKIRAVFYVFLRNAYGCMGNNTKVDYISIQLFIRIASSITTFKSKLKAYYIDSYTLIEITCKGFLSGFFMLLLWLLFVVVVVVD